MAYTLPQKYSWRASIASNAVEVTFTQDVLERLWDLAKHIVRPSRSSAAPALVLTAGNGGSHALAEHLTGELVWRLSEKEVIGIPSLCLTSNSSVITAVSNDTNWESALGIAARPAFRLHPLGVQTVLLAFSTSGTSKNILDLADSMMYQCGVRRVLFTGTKEDKELPFEEVFTVKADSDFLERVNTAVIQEVHQVYVHILCEMIAENLVDEAHHPSWGPDNRQLPLLFT